MTSTYNKPSPSPTDYADIFVAAIEGGIGYWASVSNYRWMFSDSKQYRDDPTTDTPPEDDFAKATIIDLESETRMDVDSRSIEWHNAVAQAADYFGQSLVAFIEDHDAGSGDVAMQFVVYGEVIYG